MSRSETMSIIQNKWGTVPIDITMHQILGRTNSVPILRTSIRGETDRSVNNNARMIEDWHTKELVIWKLLERILDKRTWRQPTQLSAWTQDKRRIRGGQRGGKVSPTLTSHLH